MTRARAVACSTGYLTHENNTHAYNCVCNAHDVCLAASVQLLGTNADVHTTPFNFTAVKHCERHMVLHRKPEQLTAIAKELTFVLVAFAEAPSDSSLARVSASFSTVARKTASVSPPAAAASEAAWTCNHAGQLVRAPIQIQAANHSAAADTSQPHHVTSCMMPSLAAAKNDKCNRAKVKGLC